MRYQGINSDGEPISSSYVHRDEKELSAPAVVVDCSNLPSLTRQEFAAECDINTLMSQYEKTGLLPQSAVNNTEPRYLDVSDVPDLMSALNLLNAATEAFMALPAITRREFDNDPVKFIQYAENPENLDRMREWGLAPPKPQPAPPTEVKVVAMPPGDVEAPAKK